VTHPSEVDETAEAMAAQMRRALIVARRAAQARRLAATRRPSREAPTATRRVGAAVVAAALAARENAVLADQWRREALAARWVAADVTRDQDPVAAAAWDERVRDAGIDPDEVRAEALDGDVGDPGTATAPGEGTAVDAEPAPPRTDTEVRDRWFRREPTEPSPEVAAVPDATFGTERDPGATGPGDGTDPTSAATAAAAGLDAADLVTEHLAETYTDEALDRAGGGDPTPTPTVGDLIAATEPVQRDLPASAAFSVSSLGNDEGVDAALDVGPEQSTDEGIER